MSLHQVFSSSIEAKRTAVAQETGRPRSPVVLAPLAVPSATKDPLSRILQRIAVKEKDRVFFVNVLEVDWFEAASDYVCLHVGQKRHLVRARIRDVERQLDPSTFARIHRSSIVNLDRVTELRPLSHGEYLVVLRDKTELTLSRGYHEQFLSRMLYVS